MRRLLLLQFVVACICANICDVKCELTEPWANPSQKYQTRVIIKTRYGFPAEYISVTKNELSWATFSSDPRIWSSTQIQIRSSSSFVFQYRYTGPEYAKNILIDKYGGMSIQESWKQPRYYKLW